MFYFSIILFIGCIELIFVKNYIYWFVFVFGYVVVVWNDVK